MSDLSPLGPFMADPRIVKLVAEISPARLQSTLKTLESFQTRHLLSDSPTAPFIPSS